MRKSYMPVIFAVMLSAIAGSCSSNSLGSTATIRVGSSGEAITDGAVRVTVEAVRVRGTDVAIGNSTLKMPPPLQPTHTFVSTELQIENLTDTPLGISDESIAMTTGGEEVVIVMFCDTEETSERCHFASGSTLYFYMGDPRSVTVFWTAESGADQFDIELLGTTLLSARDESVQPATP